MTSPHLTFDLMRGSSYFPSHSGPPAPVLAAFGVECLNECRLHGSWDFERAITENPQDLHRSVRLLGTRGNHNNWDDVLLKFGERSFLYGSGAQITGYASTFAEAEQIVRDFTDSFGNETIPVGGSFQLIRKARYDEIVCETVNLGPETVLNEEAFALHYPTGAGEWHRSFVDKLNGRKNGLSILEGTPGTGKTSYLRHLMGHLKDTHRFYFIPPTSLKMLEEPEFIGFWSSQRETYSDRKLVVILEDADDALMTRETDNRDKVSAILNLSDGMLSDFLQLQVICTINCAAADIDQALLRPGRLVSHRIFERLDPAHAALLAASIGKNLPHARDYSLAEIFAENQNDVKTRPTIRFARTL